MSELPEPFVAFFRQQVKFVTEEMQNKLEILAETNLEDFLEEDDTKPITNAMILEMIGESEEVIIDKWVALLVTISNKYKQEFGLKIPEQAISQAKQSFVQQVPKVIDDSVQKILRWPLDLDDDDLFRATDLLSKNLKNKMRKALHKLRDHTPPPLKLLTSYADEEDY